MNISKKVAKVVSPLRRGGAWACLAAILAGPLVLSSLKLQGDEAPANKVEKSSLAVAELIFRGAENAAAGQRFTLEVFILNSGVTQLKDLEFHASLDENLEQPSKAREHREAVTAIDRDDLHIVRLTLTPRKAGPGGIDIVLRDKNGATQQVRYVMPIAAVAAQPAEQPKGASASPLQFKIASLKECLADQSGIILINVRNSNSKPMSKKLDLVFAYESMSRANPGGGPQVRFGDGVGQEAVLRMGRGLMPKMPGNPTRKAEVSLPVLDSGESYTLPVRLTPRRIGELGVAITAKNNPQATLATVRLPVRFNPDVQVEALLPVCASGASPIKLPTSLAEVPEVSLEGPHAKSLTAEEAFEHVAHLIEKINHGNQSKTDGAMEALIKHRSDLGGLPFTLGGACRLPTERGQQFVAELSRLRIAMSNPANMAGQLPNPTAEPETDATLKARIAALVQVVEPEGPQLGEQMVKYLAGVRHVDATRALAKLAISADDEKVREGAVAALASRRDTDFSGVLLNGLNYPWPAVAQRAADAIVKLKLTDLAPQLVDALERPDPRAPQLTEKDGKKVHVVRELVRINHLRNCLLCHSPANPDLVTAALSTSGPGPARDGIEAVGGSGGRAVLSPNGPLTAPVPLPNQALPTPSPSGGYGRFAIPDTQVAFDVTYLRQDFSVKLPVADAKPWPEQQRFDFLVRTRPLSEQEAQAYRVLLQPAAAGVLSPYHRAAVTALRQLTGRDAAPTATAWRQLLTEIKTESN